MRLRKLEAHESALLRELRLRALQDAPSSFRDTYSDMVVRPASYWDDLTREVTNGERNVAFIAYDVADLVGLAFGLVDPVQNGTGRAGGMWVDPRWRRQGIGEALLRKVINWAQEQQLERLKLWCVVDAVGPCSLYRKLGFELTGSQQPLSKDSTFRVAEMELQL